jgi:membrane protein
MSSKSRGSLRDLLDDSIRIEHLRSKPSMTLPWNGFPSRMSVFARAWGILSGAVSKSIDDRLPKLAAALVYYTVFSLAPLLVVAVAVAGRLYGQAAARGEVAAQLQRLIGTIPAQMIEATIRTAARQHGGWIPTTISTVVLLFGASFVFYDMQDSLDMIWNG